MENPPAGSKTLLAKTLGVSRASLYYVSVRQKKDWLLKTRIETVLREHPGYGSRRLAMTLHHNRKAVQRVMRQFGLNGGTFFTNLILRRFGSDLATIRSNGVAMDFVRQLTTPSQSYARTVCRLVGWCSDGSPGEPLANIAGIAHITGGGAWGKFGELLPEGVSAILNTMPDPADVLLRAQDLSQNFEDLRLTDHQAYGTLHGGCGMLLVCHTIADAKTVIRAAMQDGIRAQIVGRTLDQFDHSEKLIIHSRFADRGRPLKLSELSAG